MRIVVGVVVLAALFFADSRETRAQPATILGEPVQADAKGASTTKIPVTTGATEVLAAEGLGISAASTAISLEEPIDPEKYVCGPGDVFELNFWGQQNFRLRIASDLEARAFITKVGFVRVGGKTLSAVRKEVIKKVRANYPGLNFELTLVTPRSFVVHVVNQVEKPGGYVAHAFDRASTVLSRVGVLGSRRRIKIHRTSGTDISADLVLYELTGDTQWNPFLLDGDIISIPPTDLTASIDGAVHRPGSYELVKTKDLHELIELAGGLSAGVSRSLPVRVVRHNEKQQEVFEDVPYQGEGPPNTSLRAEDRVFVRGVEQLQRSVLLIGAVTGADSLDAATGSKRLPYVEGDTLLSLIDRAGGIKAPGDLKRSYISRATASGPPTLIPVDLEAVLMRRDFTADKAVAINDVIVIPPMRYSVNVEGAVTRAGLYGYNPQFGVDEYIAQAGGRTRVARAIEDVRIVDPSGKISSYKKDRRITPGDSIVVPERNWTRAEIVQIAFAGASLLLSTATFVYAVTR
jgi:polysaccharide biosynthesis/export protein